MNLLVHYFYSRSNCSRGQKDRTYSGLELIADEALLRPPICGGGPLREALWKTVHAQDEAFDQAFAPMLQGDACFGTVDATFYTR